MYNMCIREMHLNIGDRAFQENNKIFSTVTRTKILGLDNSLVIFKDNGTMEAVCGSSSVNSIVNKNTTKDGGDIVHSLPVDVKDVGPAVLTSEGIDPIAQVALFQKFMVLPEETRVQTGQDWVESISNSDTSFVPTLISNLNSDNTIVKDSVTVDIMEILDQTTRDELFTKLISKTDEETYNIIVQFTETKNLRKEREILMQDVVYSLLDNDTYLYFEMNRFGRYVFDTTILSEKIESFLTNKTFEEKVSIIVEWKKRKYFINRKFASLYVKQILNTF